MQVVPAEGVVRFLPAACTSEDVEPSRDPHALSLTAVSPSALLLSHQSSRLHSQPHSPPHCQLQSQAYEKGVADCGIRGKVDVRDTQTMRCGAVTLLRLWKGGILYL